MKSLFILFAIVLLCNSQGVPGGYTQLTDDQIQNNSLILDLAQYGAGNVVQGANQNGNLPNSDTNFTLTSINSVYQQVVNGVNYLFNVTLTNNNNGIILDSIYTVYYQPASQARRMVSATYNIRPHAPIPTVDSTTANASQLVGGYTLIPADEVQNSSLIQQLADIGAQNLVQLLSSSGNLLDGNTNLTISSINSVYQQVVNGINYKFNVTLSNSNGDLVSGSYIVYYQPLLNNAQVLSSSYYIPSRIIPAQTITNNQTNTNALLNNNDTNTITNTTTNASVIIANATNAANASNDTSNLTLPISISQAVTPIAITPEVATIEGPAAILVDGTSFAPIVITAETPIAVIANDSNIAPVVTIAEAPAAVIANDSNIAPVTTIAEAPAPILINAEAPASIAANNGNLAPETISAPAQTANANGGQITGGYTVLNNSRIQDPLIQSLAEFGARNISGLVLANERVGSNSNFTISKINTVAAQVVNGINYKFNVLLANADNSTRVAADYIVYYQARSNTRRVSDAAYAVMPK